jgi:hypothetical protein
MTWRLSKIPQGNEYGFRFLALEIEGSGNDVMRSSADLSKGRIDLLKKL